MVALEPVYVSPISQRLSESVPFPTSPFLPHPRAHTHITSGRAGEGGEGRGGGGHGAGVCSPHTRAGVAGVGLGAGHVGGCGCGECGGSGPGGPTGAAAAAAGPAVASAQVPAATVCVLHVSNRSTVSLAHFLTQTSQGATQGGDASARETASVAVGGADAAAAHQPELAD